MRGTSMCAMYHTHSGVGLVGASIWDLHDHHAATSIPKLVGINYDVGHATIEGGLGGWIESFRDRGQPPARHRREGFRLGQGRARARGRRSGSRSARAWSSFRQFFGDGGGDADFDGPLQIHYEYPLGGANNGAAR